MLIILAEGFNTERYVLWRMDLVCRGLRQGVSSLFISLQYVCYSNPGKRWSSLELYRNWETFFSRARGEAGEGKKPQNLNNWKYFFECSHCGNKVYN